MNIEETLNQFKKLEETFLVYKEVARNYYTHKFNLRKLQSQLSKSCTNPIPYNKFARLARNRAKKLAPSGRGQIEHKVSCYFLWLLNFTPDDCNLKDNLCRLSARKNQQKSFCVDWSVFEKLYLPKLKEREQL